MKPVMQTRVGQSQDAPGNCFSACVASILECSLSDLPDEEKIIAELKVEFADKWDGWSPRYKFGKSWERLWAETQKLLAARNLTMLEVKIGAGGICNDCWCIISAKSPRGFEHSCVGRGLSIVHDPHPDGGGVAEEDRTYIFFVTIDPRLL